MTIILKTLPALIRHHGATAAYALTSIARRIGLGLLLPAALDAMADLLAMRSGTMTLAQAIARQGHNPDAVLAEIATMNAKLDALGLILDSDPRRVTKTGVMQADAATVASEREN